MSNDCGSTMNERIRELADQAVKYSLSNVNRDSEFFTPIAMEKFAELIVRECVQFIDEENVRLCEYQNSLPEWDGNRRDDCDLVIEKCIDLAERLKEHFGVEE